MFLAFVFMGFAHGIIEDTALMMALGADGGAILVGRLAFALLATGLIAALLSALDRRRRSGRIA